MEKQLLFELNLSKKKLNLLVNKKVIAPESYINYFEYRIQMITEMILWEKYFHLKNQEKLIIKF